MIEAWATLCAEDYGFDDLPNGYRITVQDDWEQEIAGAISKDYPCCKVDVLHHDKCSEIVVHKDGAEIVYLADLDQ